MNAETIAGYLAPVWRKVWNRNPDVHGEYVALATSYVSMDGWSNESAAIVAAGQFVEDCTE